MTATVTPPAAPARPGRARRLSRWLDAHPRVKLGGLLTGPVAWLLVAYIGALLALMLNALYHVDPFTSAVVHKFGTDNFHRLFTDHVYRAVTIRTIGIAAAVTVIDFAIACRSPSSWPRWHPHGHEACSTSPSSCLCGRATS